MFTLGKLLALLAMRRSLPDTALLQRIVESVASLILLTFVTASMLVVLLIGGLYGIDRLLVNYGLTEDAASIVVASLAILITVTLVVLIDSRLHQLQSFVHKVMHPKPLTVVNRVTNVADSFFTGLMTPPRYRRR